MKRSLFCAVFFAVIKLSSVLAEPPPEPLPGSDIDAEHAIVVDPLRGLEPGEPGNLYEHDADNAAHMASTTKSFTLLLAVEAVNNNTVELSDIVTISIKAATVTNNHPGGHSIVGFPAGEQVSFQDLLYAMMLPSGADAAIAIAQYVAVSADSSLAFQSDAEQEAAFVNMMNQRATELGLTQTAFSNPYGGDHFHFADNSPGGKLGSLHQASTRDMARWFNIGMQYPLYRTVVGFQGGYSFNAGDGTSYGPFNNSILNNYPGAIGAKGGTGANGISVIYESRRIGRDVILADTQAQSGDGTALLDYGFAALFHPTIQAESSEWTGGWVDQDLACVNDQRAASAVVQPNGQIRVLLWGMDLDLQSIWHLNTTTVYGGASKDLKLGRGDPDPDPREPDGLTVGLGGGHPDPDPSRPGYQDVNYQPPPPETPDFVSFYDPLPPPGVGSVSDGTWEEVLAGKAQIRYAGSGNLMVIAETDQGIYLYSYAITSDDAIVLRDTRVVGQGAFARVQVLNSTLIVTGHRASDGTLLIKSWRLTPESGKLSNPLDAVTGPNLSELALSSQPGWSSSYHLVAAIRNSPGQLSLRSYSVHPITGAITFNSNSTNALATRLSLTHVSGFGNRDIYAIAYRSFQGQLVVESYEYNNDGTLSQRGSTVGLALSTPTPNAEIKIVEYREGGVMVAVQADPALPEHALEVWSLDASATSNTVTPNRITTESIAQNGLHGLCRAPYDKDKHAAEGDFLLAYGTLGVDGVRLQHWRSAPRQ